MIRICLARLQQQTRSVMFTQMGGEPKVALNIVGFPNCLDPQILGDILAGGADKVKEAGAVLVGGHTVQDDEPEVRTLCVRICTSKEDF